MRPVTRTGDWYLREKFVPLDAPAHLVFDGQPEVGPAGQVRGVDAVIVLAGGLGLVHGDVGVAQQVSKVFRSAPGRRCRR